jgi:hypothetical protein
MPFSRHKPTSFPVAGLLFLLLIAGPAGAQADDAQSPPEKPADTAAKDETKPDDDVVRLKEDVVVTGSRTDPRTTTDSMVPVDVLSSREFEGPTSPTRSAPWCPRTT